MPCTKVRFDLFNTVNPDSGKRSPYSPQKKLGKDCVVVISKEVLAQRLSVNLGAPSRNLVFHFLAFFRDTQQEEA